MEQKEPAKLAWFLQRAPWLALSIPTTRFAASPCRCRIHPRQRLPFRSLAERQWSTLERKSEISTQRAQRTQRKQIPSAKTLRAFSKTRISLPSLLCDLCELCVTNPQIRCEPRRNVAFRGSTREYMVCPRLVAAPPRYVKSRGH